MPQLQVSYLCGICGDTAKVSGRWSPSHMVMEEPAIPLRWSVLVSDTGAKIDVCPKHEIKIDGRAWGR